MFQATIYIRSKPITRKTHQVHEVNTSGWFLPELLSHLQPLRLPNWGPRHHEAVSTILFLHSWPIESVSIIKWLFYMTKLEVVCHEATITGTLNTRTVNKLRKKERTFYCNIIYKKYIYLKYIVVSFHKLNTLAWSALSLWYRTLSLPQKHPHPVYSFPITNSPSHSPASVTAILTFNSID